MVVTDEGMGFFEDLKKKERQHESDLSMLNQLYDGQGDKTTLAQNRERAVPDNATALSISLQPQPFFNGVASMGRINWRDNGFSERFIICASKPFKYVKCPHIIF